MSACPVQVSASPFQRGDCRHRDVVSQEKGCRPGATASAVKNDVIHPDVQGCIEICFDLLGRQLNPDRNSTSCLTDLLNEGSEVSRSSQNVKVIP